MSWLLFFLLAALHPVAFIVIGVKSKSWKMRFLLWALLPLPAVVYCWDYFVIEREHEQMCAAEGGLKVLIQPEKADRLRLVGEDYRSSNAMGLLEKNFPQLQLVESMTVEQDRRGKKSQYYVAYTAEPNPRAGQQSLTHAADKEGPYIYPGSRVASLDANVYEISVHESKISHGRSEETRLSKDGKIYAKYTELVHWWTGIQYPDALPTWRCPDRRLQPDAPILTYEPLVNLIVK